MTRREQIIVDAFNKCCVDEDDEQISIVDFHPEEVIVIPVADLLRFAQTIMFKQAEQCALVARRNEGYEIEKAYEEAIVWAGKEEVKP